MADQDREHIERIVRAYKQYSLFSQARLKKTVTYFRSLPEECQSLATTYYKHLNKIPKCIATNYSVVKLIIADCEDVFRSGESTLDTSSDQERSSCPVDPMDMEKVQSTLKQFSRDWSSIGKEERDKCYKPIIEEIKTRYPPEKRKDTNVLVPGAGLGRLAWELAHEGFSSEGNEFSLFMLLASNFVLNKCSEVDQYELHPFVHQYNNNRTSADQVRKVTFPDVNPNVIPPHVVFKMVAGDFLEVYSDQDETFDCVASCFFLDCANNVIEFIQMIWKILKPGGVWVNLGPLLYHFADIPGEESIEPPYEAVKEIITKTGFTYLKEEQHVKTTYSDNPNAMVHYVYDSVFFVCHKPIRFFNGNHDDDKENFEVPSGTST